MEAHKILDLLLVRSNNHVAESRALIAEPKSKKNEKRLNELSIRLNELNEFVEDLLGVIENETKRP